MADPHDSAPHDAAQATRAPGDRDGSAAAPAAAVEAPRWTAAQAIALDWLLLPFGLNLASIALRNTLGLVLPENIATLFATAYVLIGWLTLLGRRQAPLILMLSMVARTPAQVGRAFMLMLAWPLVWMARR